MKNKQNLFPTCLLSAMWLVVGVLPADAQLTNLDHRVQIGTALYCRSCSPQTNFSTGSSDMVTSGDFTTNANWNLSGQTSAAQQVAHIQGLHYSGTGAFAAEASPENPNNLAKGESGFSIFGEATAPTVFRFSGQCTRSGGDPNYGKPQFILQDNYSGNLVNIQDAGATNLTGVVRGNFVFHTFASVGVFGGSSASSTYTFDLQFYTLPEGANQISGEIVSGGNMRLTYFGIAGINYALDRTFNLAPPDWIAQATNMAGGGGLLLFTNTPDPTTNNFWRIRSVP